MTDVITDNALAWLKQYQEEDAPFFLYLAYNAPHWPLHAKDKDIAKYKGIYDQGYKALRKERYQKMIAQQLIRSQVTPLYEEDLPDWSEVPEKIRKLESRRMEIHAAMVDSLDQNIGRVIEQLKKSGELENTLICFFADNGASHERDTRAFANYKSNGKEKLGGVMSYECIGRHWARAVNSPFAKHKITSHEGGVCSPLIVHWPKKVATPGSFNDTPVHLVDLMSTVIDVSGGQYPETFSDKPTKPIDGVSIAPAIYGKVIAARTVPIGYDYGRGQGLRDGNWRLVKFGKDSWELYDMSKDRTETNNLAKQHPEKVSELIKKYQQWLQHCSSAPQKINSTPR